jgi:hypothetical protein
MERFLPGKLRFYASETLLVLFSIAARCPFGVKTVSRFSVPSFLGSQFPIQLSETPAVIVAIALRSLQQRLGFGVERSFAGKLRFYASEMLVGGFAIASHQADAADNEWPRPASRVLEIGKEAREHGGYTDGQPSVCDCGVCRRRLHATHIWHTANSLSGTHFNCFVSELQTPANGGRRTHWKLQKGGHMFKRACG